MRDGTDDDEIFVGYLPTPPRTLRFVRVIIVLALVLAPALAAVLVLGAGDTGQGVSALAQTEGDGLVGLLELHPYGVLWAPSDHGPEGVLLVSQGKFGIGSQFAPLDGTIVRVQGLVLARDGQRMIELGTAPVPASLDDAVTLTLRERTLASEGEVLVTGEIVDEKCWLGRMRPGGGRTHRACAQLCVAGGIPPVLVGIDEHGHDVRAVIVDEDGAPSTEWVLPFVAEPVRVRGELVRDGSLAYVRTSAAAIERR
jgi:hypothetical protein